MATTHRVQSTSRKSGKQTTLDPRFLDRKAAESFIANLERKAGEWYTYQIVSDDPEGDAAWQELGIDPEVARKSTSPRSQDDRGEARAPWVAPEPSEAAAPHHGPSRGQIEAGRREVAEIERKAWAKFAGRDLTQKATPQDTDEVTTEGICRRCGGTGAFVTYVENGIPKGPGGRCYRCDGKTYQTLADVRRNEYRDRHQTVSL